MSVYKNLVRVIFYIMFVVHIVMVGFYGINVTIVNINEENLKYDFDAIRVDRVEGDLIYLLDGSEVRNSDVRSFIKVREGVGNWYLEEYKTLIVETNILSILKVVGTIVFIGLIVSSYLNRSVIVACIVSWGYLIYWLF